MRKGEVEFKQRRAISLTNSYALKLLISILACGILHTCCYYSFLQMYQQQGMAAFILMTRIAKTRGKKKYQCFAECTWVGRTYLRKVKEIYGCLVLFLLFVFCLITTNPHIDWLKLYNNFPGSWLFVLEFFVKRCRGVQSGSKLCGSSPSWSWTDGF